MGDINMPSAAQLKVWADAKKIEADAKRADDVDRAIRPRTAEGIVRARGW